MTTQLFFEEGGAPLVEQFLIKISGKSAGDREVIHNEKVTEAVGFTKPKMWDPSQHSKIQEAAVNRSLVIWKRDPKYSFIPGPGVVGKSVTLHVCWVPPGHKAPTTEAEFGCMPGYQVETFGGLSDPNFNRGWMDVPFSTARHRIIISNVIKVSSPMKLCWAVECESIGDKKGTGALFFLRIDGLVEVFGSFM